MPKKNEKLIMALEEVTELKFKLVAAQAEIKAARREERMKIAREILAEGE
jgi:signal transduction histidine kinase